MLLLHQTGKIAKKNDTSYLLFLIQSLSKHKNGKHTDFLSLNAVKIMMFSIEEVLLVCGINITFILNCHYLIFHC